MPSCVEWFKGERVEQGVPALEEDFVGDIDLARSAQAIQPWPVLLTCYNIDDDSRLYHTSSSLSLFTAL